MKRLALALCSLLILASPAISAPRQYGMLAKWQQSGFPSSNKPKTKRVAVIYDRDLRESNWGNANTNDVDLFAGMGKLVECLRNQGADVNVFDYSLFADSNGVVPTAVAVGQTVSGTGISGGTTVAYVDPSRTFLELSANATANNGNATLTIGGVSADQWKIVSGTKQVRRMVSSNPAFRTLGDTYGLAVMVGFRALFRTNASTEAKFFCPESTNVQMIHVGGIPSYSAFDDGSSPLYGAGDSTRSNASNTSTTNGRGVVPYLSTGGLQPDTLWGERINYGVAPIAFFTSSKPTGFLNFVRLFHPVMNTGAGAASDSARYWGGAFDSTLSVNKAATYGAGTAQYRYRYGWWATHSDSVVRQPYEPMPVAWRAYWTDTNADGKDHVDFVKVHSGANTRYVNGDVALALCARYVQLKPVLMAYEMDDMANMNPTDGHSAGRDGITSTLMPQGTRPSNAYLDSLVTELKGTWGVKVTANIAPDSIVAYANGTPTTEWATNPAAAVSRHTYYFNHALPWIHHAHDSSGTIGSNLVGKFGGYYPANGQNLGSPVLGYTQIPAMTPRYPDRADPYNLLDARNGGKYGIGSRLAYSDSLRRKNCPQCPLPPYLSFPNNDLLPLNWTVRNSPFPTQAGDGLANLSSTFSSMALGLRVRPDGGVLYLRGYYYILNSTFSTNIAPHWYRGTRYPQFSPVNRWIGYDRDSLAMATIWLEPEGEYRVQSGYGPATNLRVKNVGCIPVSGATSDMGGQFAKSQQMRNMLLGIANPIVRTSVWANDFGETYTADANGLASGNTNIIRNGPGRVRVAYNHPLGGTYGAGGLVEVAQFRSMILRPLRALSTVAGHDVHKWVYPWETYQ